MASYCGCDESRKLVFVDRNLFTAFPFVASGVGVDELLRGILAGDGIRIIGAIALILQGVFAATIFIRNQIAGQSWRFRSAVIFFVGGITGLLIGLLCYYPMALDLDTNISRNGTHATTTISSISSANHSSSTTETIYTSSPGFNETSTISRISQKRDLELVSKLWFLVPNFAISLLVVVNTVYGLSITVRKEKRTESLRGEEDLETVDLGGEGHST